MRAIQTQVKVILFTQISFHLLPNSLAMTPLILMWAIQSQVKVIYLQIGFHIFPISLICSQISSK